MYIMKAKINITIDPFILDQAKQKGLNISETAEKAIIHKLNPENEIDKNGKSCEYCKKEMDHASILYPNGLIWCLPDEKWICPKCLHGFTEELLKAKTG